MLNLLFLLFALIIATVVAAFNRAEAAARRQEEKNYYRAVVDSRNKGSGWLAEGHNRAWSTRLNWSAIESFRPELARVKAGQRRPEEPLTYCKADQRRSA